MSDKSDFTSAAAEKTLLGPPRSKLALRIRGNWRDGQVLQLRSPKITVGSSAQCTLRLRGPDIAPLHCLILHGSQHTIVRRWSADTRLNNCEFDDAALRLGDRLSVGPVDLEVIEAAIASELSDSVPAGPSSLPEGASSTAANVDEDSRLQLEARLSTALGHTRRRARQLIEQLRHSRSQANALEQVVVSYQQQAGNLERRQSQLESGIKTLEDQHRQWQQERADDERIFRDHQEQLDQRTRQLSTDNETLFAQRKSLDEERAAFAQVQATFNSRCAAADAEQRQFYELCQSREAAIGQRDGQLHELETLLRRRESELDARWSDLRQQTSTAQQQETALKQRALQLDAQVRSLELREKELQELRAVETASKLVAGDTVALQARLKQQSEQLIAEQTQLAEQQANLAEQQSLLNEQRAQLKADQEQWAVERQTWKDQQTVQQSQIAEWAAERTAWESKKSEWEAKQSAWEKKQADCETEHAQRLADFQKQKLEVERLQEELSVRRTVPTQQQPQLLAQQAALNDQRQSLNREQQLLEADRQAWEKLQQEFELQQSQREAEFQQKVADFKQEQADQQTRWQHDRSQQELALTQNIQNLEQRTAEFEIEQQELNRQRIQLQNDRQQLEQQATICRQSESGRASENIQSPHAIADATHADDAVECIDSSEPTSSGAQPPTSNDDVFARLRAMSLLKDGNSPTETDRTERQSERHSSVSADDSVESENESLDTLPTKDYQQPNASPQAEATQVAETTPKIGHPEDVSIDDYMAQLLERMRGPANDSAESAMRGPKSVKEESSQSTSAKSEQKTAQSQEPTVASVPLTHLEPRKAAPESTHNLAAMREIANLSARSAIATHHHRHRTNRAWSTLTVGIVGLICGVLLLWCSPDVASPFFYGGLIGLGVAGYWFMKSGILAQHLKKLKTHYHAQQMAIANEQEIPSTNSSELPTDVDQIETDNSVCS